MYECRHSWWRNLERPYTYKHSYIHSHNSNLNIGVNIIGKCRPLPCLPGALPTLCHMPRSLWKKWGRQTDREGQRARNTAMSTVGQRNWMKGHLIVKPNHRRIHWSMQTKHDFYYCSATQLLRV